MLKRLFYAFVLIISALAFETATSQVTTGSITGTVKTSDGKELEGASVKAIHEPSGTVYTTVTKNKGQFVFPNLRIGGPYTIAIQYVGLTSKKIEDLFVTLGTPININISLESGATLSEVIVSSSTKKGIISSQRTGTSTLISSGLIQNVPTVSRNVQDFARLMPQAKVGSTASNGNGVGVSFGGQNNRYNQFSIDGANASDAFGLSSSGTNGAQANINPISMESIQEMQLVLSPYDVTQGGFVGGGINAVTKSGTNMFHGAIYGQTQPKWLIGNSAPYNSTVTRNPIYGDFKNYTFGVGLGGPIIKNKLFFYLNAERFNKATPLAFDPTISGSGSKVDTSAMSTLKNFLISKYQYDPGSFGTISNNNQSTSVFGRIDWNINEKHKLVFRFNHVEGYLDILSRSATSAAFANSGYRQTNKTNSAVLELNSSLSAKASNVLRLTFSSIRDARNTSIFPNISITNFNSATSTSISYAIGSEFSSAVNGLKQDVYTLTDNFTLYKDAHTFTFGTNDEFFSSTNLFLQGYYGAYTYNNTANNTINITNFMANTGMTGYSVGFSNSSDPADKAPAVLHAAQLAIYGQDVWAVNNQFKLTYGLRIDMPIFMNKPDANQAFNTAFASNGVATNQMPKTNPLFSPRVGFNWNVNGNATTQVRGGAGLFTGRVPFVWISNQISMTGVKSSSYSPVPNNAAGITAAGIKFNYNPNDPHLGAYVPNAGNNIPVINVIDKNFKFPQVFRANLAVDQKLNLWGLIGTVEAVYTKTLNNGNYTNLNISPNGDALVNIGPSTRPFWKQYTNAAYQQVIELSNTNAGYAYSFTAQIQKPASKGWSGSIGYSYGHSTSNNDLTSSVALSNWRSPLTVNGLNFTQLSTSNFNMGSRVVGFISKEFKYSKNFTTSFTLIYTGQSGQRLSYVYGNNVLGDNGIGSSSGATALAYIPQSATEANFVDIKNSAGVVTTTAAQEWTNFQSFVSANKYLNDHVGQNTERNGDHMPFENHFDFRVAQNFILGKNKLQVFFDILNVGNLLNKNWGWSYSGISSTADGFFTASSSLFSVITSGSQLQNGTPITPTTTNPAFQFNINNFTNIKGTFRPYQVSDFTSRWNAQLGVRYSF
jgi:hypothetical protein